MKQVSFLLLIVSFSFSACNNNSSVEAEACEEDSCCQTDTMKKAESLTSEITCPKCGYKKTETMPTDVCVIKYTCEKCKTDMFPKEGDCCVFCTHGTHKCPSKQ